LFRDIQVLGYKGGYSTMTDFLREVRPALPQPFERRFETEPGQQAQADFAEYLVEFTDEPGVWRKVWLFSFVLGNSPFRPHALHAPAGQWVALGSVLPQPETGDGAALPCDGV